MICDGGVAVDIIDTAAIGTAATHTSATQTAATQTAATAAVTIFQDKCFFYVFLLLWIMLFFCNCFGLYLIGVGVAGQVLVVYQVKFLFYVYFFYEFVFFMHCFLCVCILCVCIFVELWRC